MSRQNNSAAAEIFFALGDETRLSVLARLRKGPFSATGLSDGAKVTRQAIVKHLQVLEDAGLVRHEKSGREVLYVMRPERLEEAQDYLEMISAGWDDAIERLRQMVENK